MDGSSRLDAPRRAVATASRRRPFAVDAALAAGLAALLAVAVTSAAELEHDAGRTAGAVAVAVSAAPLAWRRRAPLVVLACTSVISLAVLLGFGITGGEVLVLVAAATVVARCPPRQAAVAVGLLAGATATAVLTAPGGDLESLLAVVGTLAATVSAAAAWRLRREKAVVTAGRDAAREREREQCVSLAVAAERARISREVHDVVAHHVTVMVSLSDGAQVAAGTDPARAATAMRQVSATGRQALTELRSVLAVLKQDASGPNAPAGVGEQVGLEAVEELLATVRSAGLQAGLTVSGAERTLSAQEHATIHRIVQEAHQCPAPRSGRPDSAGPGLLRRG